MAWQDLVLAGASMALNVFTVVTVCDDDAAVPRLQSVPTFVALVAIALTYVTLGLYVAAASSVLGALLWALVAVLRPTE